MMMILQSIEVDTMVLFLLLPGGQMIVADMTEPGEWADGLGKLSFSYGIGMIVGPIVGGLVNKAFGWGDFLLAINLFRPLNNFGFKIAQSHIL